MADDVMVEEGSDDDVIPLFSIEEVYNAAKDSNFNKGLGPDCFDGSVLAKNEPLCKKVIYEITEALNDARIPDYLRSGRLVPL
ncbi:MAG: hypothetical protein ACKO7B_12465 [Flavobacteriales bacterium]